MRNDDDAHQMAKRQSEPKGSALKQNMAFAEARARVTEVWSFVGYDRGSLSKWVLPRDWKKAGAGAVDFDKMAAWITSNPGAMTPEFLFTLAGKGFIAGRKAQSIAAASSKNEKAREWALSEWMNRPDTGQGKAAFGRQYAPLVKKKFRLPVTPETIARDWLPKSKG